MKEIDVFSVDYFIRRLRQARGMRIASGWVKHSHRWFFAEGDGIPGLVIDAFLTGHDGWLIVVQASTAGVERVLENIFKAIAAFAEEFGELTIVEAPSSKARASEGLAVSKKKIISGPLVDIESCEIQLLNNLSFKCDILNGQKTGFFLDQQWNVGLLLNFLNTSYWNDSVIARGVNDKLRVLDICSYVGQWSSHIAKAANDKGFKSGCTLIDVSSDALSVAGKNLARFTSDMNLIKGDALEKLDGLDSGAFDVVICDPPAFVKKKTDFEAGRRAYVKLLRDSLKRVKPGGILVASSCSGLVRSSDWREIMADACSKAGRMFTQVIQGGHGPDHPVRPEFPEGYYLKCVIGRVDYPY